MSAAAEEVVPVAANDAGHAPPPAGKGKMKLIIIIAAVMMVEAAAMYLLIPRGSAASAEEESHDEAGGHGGHDAHGGGHGGHGHSGGGHDVPKSDTMEVPIESIICTNNRASPGSIIHMSFKLVAIIATPQKDAFEMSANGENKARVRQAIIKVARSSNMEELSDPELSTMKRLFREEMNKVLKKSYVIEVVISDFKTIEQ